MTEFQCLTAFFSSFWPYRVSKDTYLGILNQFEEDTYVIFIFIKRLAVTGFEPGTFRLQGHSLIQYSIRAS